MMSFSQLRITFIFEITWQIFPMFSFLILADCIFWSLSGQIYRENGHCPENYFLVRQFFCATFSFWGMVNFVYSRIWSMWPFICKRLIQTPTSETRVLNPKSCGVHGRSNGTKGVEGEGGGGEAPYQNSYGQHLRWSTLFWKMRNELKQIWNRFSILSIFSFWDMVVFVLKIG